MNGQMAAAISGRSCRIIKYYINLLTLYSTFMSTFTAGFSRISGR